MVEMIVAGVMVVAVVATFMVLMYFVQKDALFRINEAWSLAWQRKNEEVGKLQQHVTMLMQWNDYLLRGFQESGTMLRADLATAMNGMKTEIMQQLGHAASDVCKKVRDETVRHVEAGART